MRCSWVHLVWGSATSDIWSSRQHLDRPQSQSLTCDWPWNLARVSWAVSAVVVKLLKPVDPPPTKPQSWLVSRANQLKISVSFAPSGPALAAALFSVRHIIPFLHFSDRGLQPFHWRLWRSQALRRISDPAPPLARSSTYLRCSMEFVKLLVVRSHRVCWKADAGREEGVDSVTDAYICCCGSIGSGFGSITLSG